MSSVGDSSDDDNDQPKCSVKSLKLDQNFKLLKQGAEAKVFVCTYLGMPTIVKERFVKKYRHPDLDEALTKERIKNEARSIARCKIAGIRTPVLYLVDEDRRRIYMEYIDNSMTVKDYLSKFLKRHKSNDEVDVKNLTKEVANMIGVTIGRLHNCNIIHGDLTTSNLLLVPSDPLAKPTWLNLFSMEIAIIDFGLSYVGASAEDKGVDLYVLERSVISTHNDYKGFFDDILLGYIDSITEEKEILSKFEEVRARGRKRTMVG